MTRSIVIQAGGGLFCWVGFLWCSWALNPWAAQSLFAGECPPTARGVPWPVYTSVCGYTAEENWLWRNMVLNFLVWAAIFLCFCALVCGIGQWRAFRHQALTYLDGKP